MKLKKFLSLAMAAVMLCGSCVTANADVTVNDVADSMAFDKYTEDTTVLSAVNDVYDAKEKNVDVYDTSIQYNFDGGYLGFDKSTGTITYVYSSEEKIDIPNMIKDVEVTAIGNEAFRYCNSLVEINLPSTLKSIGVKAFKGCTSLQKLVLPEGVTSLGSNMLGETAVKSIVIPKSVQEVKGVSGSEVTTDNGSPFMGADMLTEVIFEDGTTKIPNGFFSGHHTNNEECKVSVTNVVIPASVTEIGYNAFSQCKNLKTIDIPSSVTIMGDFAFQGCSSLEKINIPNGVKSIGEDVFYNCTSLKTIDIPLSVTMIGNEAFRGCSSLENINISSSVTVIGNRALQDCSNLEKINIPKGVKSIGEYAFYNDDKLAEVVIPGSVEKIENYTFENCKNLSKIVIEDGVKKVGEYAFENCPNVTYFSVTNSVEKLSQWSGDTWPYCFEKLETLITGCENSARFINDHYPVYYNNTKKGYRRYDNLRNVTLLNGVTNFNFSGCGALINVTFAADSAIEDIPLYAFGGCYNIIDIKLPQSVKKINTGAFAYSRIRKITIPKNVETIEDGAFCGCEYLYEIKVDNDNKYYKDIDGILFDKNVKTLVKFPSYYAAYNKVKSYTIPDTVEKIEYGAFGLGGDPNNNGFEHEWYNTLYEGAYDYLYLGYNDAYLTNIKIPKSVKEIGDWAFTDCSGLTSIDIPNGISKIGIGVFENCRSLENIELPSGVSEIGERAFRGCEKLKSITIPASVNEIYCDIFIDCTNLKDVYYGGSEQEWNNKYIVDDYLDVPDFVVHFNSGSLPTTVTTTETTTVTTTETTTETTTATTTATTTETTTATTTETTTEATTEAGVLNDNISYSFGSGKLNLSGSGEMPDMSESDIWGGIKADVRSAETGEGITKIGESAFEDFTSLNEVLMTPDIAEIGDKAFSGCSSLKELYIPDTVTSIGALAFEGMDGAVIYNYSNVEIDQTHYGTSNVTVINTSLEKGDPNCDNRLTADDAENILSKVLDEVYKPKIERVTRDIYPYTDINGDSVLTAFDAASVLTKVLDDTFEL